MIALYQTAGLFWSYSIFTCVAITFYIFVKKGHPRGPLGGPLQRISATPQKSRSHARGMCAPNFKGQWTYILWNQTFLGTILVITFACTIPDLWPHFLISNCFYQHVWWILKNAWLCFKNRISWSLVDKAIFFAFKDMNLIFYSGETWKSILCNSNHFKRHWYKGGALHCIESWTFF